SQTRLWTAGHGGRGVLVALCALTLRWKPAVVATGAATAVEPLEDRPPWRRRLYWVALAFVPSSLLLGATTYITTDLAAVPLLWVLPLAIYLLTFILAFGRWPRLLHRLVVAATLPVVLLVMFLMVSSLPERIWATVLWHFSLLFVVALAAHGELAQERPAPRPLTPIYPAVS